MVSKKRALSAISGNAVKAADGLRSDAKRRESRRQGQSTNASLIPPEIWSLIGEHIFNRNDTTTLEALVGVSRAFRVIYSPFLFSRRILYLERFSKTLEHPSLPPGLEFVKDFRINLHDFSDVPDGPGYDEEQNDALAQLVFNHLDAMPSLRSFSWYDAAFVASHGTALILKDANVQRKLKNMPGLESVMIQFCSQYIDDPVAAYRCYFPLQGFKGLTSLELYDFYGDEVEISEDIAGVLCDCPQLKTLGLAMASEVDLMDTEVIIMPETDHCLQILCESYASRCKTPLQLESLRLGWGMGLYTPRNKHDMDMDGDVKDHFLHKLLDITKLRSFEIFNGWIVYDFEDAAIPEIDYSPFLSAENTNLRRLSITRLRGDTHEFLAQRGRSVQELFIKEDYG